MYKGNDKITLQPAESDYHLYFGSNSVIQDCDLALVVNSNPTYGKSENEMVYKLKRAEKLHVYGEKDSGLPCRGIVDKEGTVADIKIQGDSVVRAKHLGTKYENYALTIYYKPADGAEANPLLYEMLGGEKTWF